jgi:hypothetical protein
MKVFTIKSNNKKKYKIECYKNADNILKCPRKNINTAIFLCLHLEFLI